ncbi:MAG TPA: acyltransferase [Myxococcaceae bacterium]
MPPVGETRSAPAATSTWLDRLRDPDGTTPNLPYLDGIRAFAVLMILLRHAWGLSGAPPLGFTLPLLGEVRLTPLMVMFSSGVDLFFVLSGFLLARSYLRADFLSRPPPNLWRYYAQRIVRIGPPYWITLLLVLFLFTPSLIPAERVYSKPGLLMFLVHLVFGQTAFLPAFGWYHIETPFWTLTIEMMFYLALPLMVRAFLRRRWVVSVPLTLALVLGWLYCCRYGFQGLVQLVRDYSLFGFGEDVTRFFLSHTFPAHLLHFALGITLCNLVVRRELGWRSSPAFQAATGPRAGLLYLAAGVALTFYWFHRHGQASLTHGWAFPLNYMNAETAASREYYFLEEIPFAISYGLILFGASLAPEWVRRVLSLPALCFFGVVGYSVYLWHMPILYQLNSLPWMAALTDPSRHFWALLAAGTLVTVLVSTGFFIAVERPVTALAKRLGRSPAPRASEAPASPAAPEAASVPVQALSKEG